METHLNRKGKPVGAKSHPELYILFNMGMDTKQIIKMGYRPPIVYRYHKKYEDAKELIKKMLMKPEPD